ncbi:MAG TPA: carboxypeptidase-like regulatory domain-containing protein [Bryobacteraceae bacterium]|nr:carboxypeptidase-like regulatory domain-containing protein [Bryobacteraceae bacterium]
MPVLSVLTAAALGCFAQQSTNPALNSHPNDQATFGNKKPPKKDKAPTSRTVTGQVTDEAGKPLEGAMVTLTDKATNERTTFFTKKDGRYQFEDLSFNKDYEVQARFKDAASDARKLSQYDTTPRPVRILQINTGAKPAAETAADSKKP